MKVACLDCACAKTFTSLPLNLLSRVVSGNKRASKVMKQASLYMEVAVLAFKLQAC